MATFYDLPEDVQILYLLDLRYEEVIEYCNSTKLTRKICKSAQFWNQKANHDFGLSLKIVSLIYKDSSNPQQQYRTLQYLYEDNTDLILKTLINNKMLNRISSKTIKYLLNNSGWIYTDQDQRIGINDSFYSLLYIAAKDLTLAKVVVKYLKSIGWKISSYLLSLFYYTAKFSGSVEVKQYTKQYKNIYRSTDILLQEAMEMGNIDIVKYLLPKFSADVAATYSLKYGKPNVMEYIREIYPQYFNANFINAVTEEAIEMEDLPSIKNIVSLFGKIINYDIFLQMFAAQRSNKIYNFLQRSKELYMNNL